MSKLWFLLLVLLVMPVVYSIGSHPLQESGLNGMALYLTLNSTSITDFSGRGLTGVLSGSPIYNTSYGWLSDGSYNFDEVNDYINISDSKYLNFTNQQTIIGWIYLTSYAASNGYVVSKANGATSGYYVYISSTGTLQAEFNGYTDDFIGSGGLIPLNKWTFFAVTQNGTHMRTYVNGSLTNTDDTGGGVMRVNSSDLTIGARSFNPSGTYLNGNVDEIIIYNKSLTPREIWNLYYVYYGLYNKTSSRNIYGDINVKVDDYRFNTSTVNTPALSIKSDNLMLNFNFSNWIGNLSGTFISGTGFKNITVRNLRAYNYTYGIWFLNSNLSKIKHNKFFGMANAIRLRNPSFSDIYNNTIFKNLTFSETSDSGIFLYSGVYLSSTKNNISYNIINNSENGIQLDGNISYGKIHHNRLFNQSKTHIALVGNSSYNQVYSNYINWTVNHDAFNGIRISTSFNNVTNNSIFNVWHVGIDLFQCEQYARHITKRNRIINNTIINMNEGGHIQLCNASYNHFDNNFLKNNTKKENPTNTKHPIQVKNGSSSNYFKNINLTGIFKSDLLSVFDGRINDNNVNNTFVNINFKGSNNPRYDLRVQHSINTTFQNISGKDSYVIANQNSNRTRAMFWNLNNALLFHENGTVYCTNVPSCDGNRNITLYSNDSTVWRAYILNNFNITESRFWNHTPVIFTSSSTSTLKKIASNLSQAINATVRMNVAHTNIKDIVFINNDSRDYSPDTWNFVGGQAEFTLNNIAPNSNTIYIDYGTQPIGQQQTIKGKGLLRYITEDIPISLIGSQYNLPLWVAGTAIISLVILAFGLFMPIAFPIILSLIIINTLLIWVTLS